MTKMGSRREIPRAPLNAYGKKREAEAELLRKLRPKLLVRCKGKCEECHGAPDYRGLHMHHKVFRSQGGKTTADNCIMLCGRCHSAAHGIREAGR